MSDYCEQFSVDMARVAFLELGKQLVCSLITHQLRKDGFIKHKSFV